MGKKRKFQALQPIAIEIELEAVPTLDHPLPIYVPPFETAHRTGEGNCRGFTELKTFQKFITDAIISLIVATTNAYAARQRETLRTTRDTRKWHDTAPWEIWRYLGCLFYMASHIEREHKAYWSGTHRLGRFMGLKRWEQIHRYFTLRHPDNPKTEDENWLWKLEPILTAIRRNCHINWLLGSRVAIDEAMIPFRGRSPHTTKIKNKPIKEGLKV